MQQQVQTQTSYFDTIVGRVGLCPESSVGSNVVGGGSDAVVGMLPYVNIFLPRYVKDLKAVGSNKRGDILLVKVKGLEDLADSLQSNAGRLPWEVTQPPALIGQVVANYLKIRGYDEAITTVEQSSIDPREVLDFARTKKINVRAATQELDAEGKLSKSTASPVANQLYMQIFKPKGYGSRTKRGIIDVLLGQPISAVERETLEALAQEDPRFDPTTGEGYKFVSFIQRAVAKALTSTEQLDPPNRIEYNGKELTEEDILAKLKPYFFKLTAHHGVAVLFEIDDKRQLQETAKPVPLAELDSLPELISANYRPIEKLLADLVILTQVLYTSVLEHAKRSYPGSNPEHATALTVLNMLPRHEYFRYLLTHPEIANNPSSRSNGSSLITPAQATVRMTQEINEKKVKVLLPYQPYAPIWDLPVLTVRGTVRMLYDHLPKELFTVESILEQLRIVNRPIGTKSSVRMKELLQGLSLAQQAVKELGVNFSTHPAFSKHPNKNRVAETLEAHFELQRSEALTKR